MLAGEVGDPELLCPRVSSAPLRFQHRPACEGHRTPDACAMREGVPPGRITAMRQRDPPRRYTRGTGRQQPVGRATIAGAGRAHYGEEAPFGHSLEQFVDLLRGAVEQVGFFRLEGPQAGKWVPDAGGGGRRTGPRAHAALPLPVRNGATNGSRDSIWNSPRWRITRPPAASNS